MRDLIKALERAGRDLDSGSMGLAELESACADAQELYERLIVIRHKAREAGAGKPGADKPQQTVTPAREPAPPPIRLDTRPPDVSIRQTSLIDAIEATAEPVKEAAPSIKRAPEPGSNTSSNRSGKTTPSVAEKLEKASIPDLGKAISLSHKFWFVSELFNGDRITYERSIEVLNKMPNRQDAASFVEKEVIAKLKKTADPVALATFMDLIERRFQ